MNLARFFEHWKILEHPFIGEEARHDPVFSRLGATETLPPDPAAPAREPIRHPDFAKILGDPQRPSSAIVFGEKGSGKTAIRLQIAAEIDRHNRSTPAARAFLISYDDLNPMLDRLCSAFRARPDDEPPEVLKALGRLRLVDHMDSILHLAVTRLMDDLLDTPRGATTALALPAQPWKVLRAAPPAMRRDLLLLQALYDRGAEAGPRTRFVRRKLRLSGNGRASLWRGLALFGWLIPAAVAACDFFLTTPRLPPLVYLYGLYAAVGLWLIFLFKWFILDRLTLRHTARRIRKQLRTLARPTESFADSLARLPSALVDPGVLPIDDQEEKRYAMFARLRRVLEPLGYKSIIIVMDRLDEPTVISGDVGRMRAVVWPMLNNKWLQQDRTGVKLLLPIELRHELFRESAAFFQEARMDKQNMIERLSWSGPMLYDLCSARLNACRAPGQTPIALSDLFDDEIGLHELIEALEHMHQPRDAFKLLYQCMQDHASLTPDEQPQWRIARTTLETARKQQAERVSLVSRGMRPG